MHQSAISNHQCCVWFVCPSTSTRSRRCATRAAAGRRASSTRSASCVAAGAPGITVHPRADRRHITPDDVREIAGGAADAAARRSNSTSKAIRAPSCWIWSTRCVPISARWCRSCRERSPARPAGRPGPERDRLPGVIGRLKALGIRVSLFVDAEPDADSVGGVGRRRSGRAVYRAVRAGVRARSGGRGAVRSRSMPKRASWRIRSASASTPATIWISTIS